MILGSDLSSTQRLVLLVLEARMKVDGTNCWPSIETIQADTGLGRTAVFDALRILRHQGWVIVQSGKGAGRSNRYSASVPDGKGSGSRTVLGKKGPPPGPKETQKRPVVPPSPPRQVQAPTRWIR